MMKNTRNCVSGYSMAKAKNMDRFTYPVPAIWTFPPLIRAVSAPTSTVSTTPER